MKQTTAMQQQ